MDEPTEASAARPLYWVGQGVFAVVFLTIAFSGALSVAGLYVFAAVQVVLVAWRLWVARKPPWLALVPLVSTVALAYFMGQWALAEDTKWGGDGATLLMGAAMIVWCVLAYTVTGVLAGLTPIGPANKRPSGRGSHWVRS
jgi:hypothetical protein